MREVIIMHGMYGGHCGPGGCGGCNCEPLTPEQEAEMLSDFQKRLEKKLEWVKERQAKLSDK